MGSESINFGRFTGSGYRCDLTTITGLPNIPANAVLDNVMVTCSCARSGNAGGSGEFKFIAGGIDATLYSGISKNTTVYVIYDIVKLGLIRNNGGVLTYSDGSTSAQIKLWHDWNVFGSSWEVNDLTITANYHIPPYYVSYSANGGSGTMETDTVQWDANYTIKSSTFTPPQHTATFVGAGDDIQVVGSKDFVAWTLDGTNYIYPGTTKTNWTSAGGTLPLKALWSNYATINFPPKPSLEGYTFVGWFRNATGNTYAHDACISINSDETLVAVWERLMPPKITLAQLLYSNKQISADNKVPVGEYFRIVVGVESYD